MRPYLYLIKLFLMGLLSRFFVFVRQLRDFISNYYKVIVIDIIDHIIDDLEHRRDKYAVEMTKNGCSPGFQKSVFEGGNIRYTIDSKFIDVYETFNFIRLDLSDEFPNREIAVKSIISLYFINKEGAQVLNTFLLSDVYTKNTLYEWLYDLIEETEYGYSLHADKKLEKIVIDCSFYYHEKRTLAVFIKFGKDLYNIFIGRYIDAIMACKAPYLNRKEVERYSEEKRYFSRKQREKEDAAIAKYPLFTDRYSSKNYVSKIKRKPLMPSPPTTANPNNDITILWTLIKGQLNICYYIFLLQIFKTFCMVFVFGYLP